MAKYPIRHDKSERRNLLLGDGKFALGLILGVVATILILLVFGSNFGLIGSHGFVDLAPVIVSLIVAGTSTFLAANALLEQRKTREAATDPVLVAHLGQRDDARELITFNITNVGAGAALHVVLNVEKPDDDLSERNLLTNIFKEHHPFTVILQDKSIEFGLAVGWDVLGERPLPPFRAKLLYEDLAGGKYETEFSIDVREMEYLGAHKSPQMRIVSALEKIANQK